MKMKIRVTLIILPKDFLMPITRANIVIVSFRFCGEKTTRKDIPFKILYCNNCYHHLAQKVLHHDHHVCHFGLLQLLHHQEVGTKHGRNLTLFQEGSPPQCNSSKPSTPMSCTRGKEPKINENRKKMRKQSLPATSSPSMGNPGPRGPRSKHLSWLYYFE